MKTKSTLFLVLAFSFLSSELVAQTEIILKQEDSPIQIFNYSAESYYLSELNEGIETKMQLKNISNGKTELVRYGVASFNSFEEFFDLSFGLVTNSWAGIKPGEIVKEHLLFPCPGIKSFTKFGTSFVFIDAVRFEDGKIWKSNKDDIVLQIKAVFQNFSGELISEAKRK